MTNEVDEARYISLLLEKLKDKQVVLTSLQKMDSRA